MPNDQEDWTSVVARPQTQLSGSPWAYGTGQTSKNFTLAADTSIVSLLLPAFFNVSNMTIVGVTSGFTYQQAEPSKTSFHPYYMAVINSAVDAAVTVTLTAGVAGTAYVSSIPDPVATVQLPNQPAPWEAPNQSPTPILFTNPAAAGTQIVIPTPSNSRSIYLHTLTYSWSANTAGADGDWQDATPNIIMYDAPAHFTGLRVVDFKGAKLAPGEAFEWLQIGSAAAGTVTCRGEVTYSLY